MKAHPHELGEFIRECRLWAKLSNACTDFSGVDGEAITVAFGGLW